MGNIMAHGYNLWNLLASAASHQITSHLPHPAPTCGAPRALGATATMSLAVIKIDGPSSQDIVRAPPSHAPSPLLHIHQLHVHVVPAFERFDSTVGTVRGASQEDALVRISGFANTAQVQEDTATITGHTVRDGVRVGCAHPLRPQACAPDPK